MLFKNFIVKATLEMSSENILNTFDMNENYYKTKTAFPFKKHKVLVNSAIQSNTRFVKLALLIGKFK